MFKAVPPSSIGSTSRPLLIIACVLLGGWLLSSLYLLFAADRLATHQAIIDGKQTAKQTALSIQPFIMAGDIISLNYILNTITSSEQVNGISVYDNSNHLIARAGEEAGNEQQVILGNKQSTSGKLKLFINITPQYNVLVSYLWQMGILSLIVIILTLFSLWIYLRQAKANTLATIAAKSAPSFSIPEPILESADDQLNEKNTADSDAPSIDAPNTPPPLEAEVTVATNTHDNASANPAMTGTADEFSDNVTPNEQATSTLNDSVETDTASESLSYSAEDIENATLTPSADHTTAFEEELNNDELVALLRPDAEIRMPHFVPTAPSSDEDIAQDQNSYTPSFQVETQGKLREPSTNSPLYTSVSNPSPNPLRAARPEEQLDLYSLEHQLELSLAPTEAAYLIYIDATTGHSDYIEPELHELLLSTYEQLLRQVSTIYGGEITIQATGDMELFFDDQDEEDSHGIHALCAAKLFTLLYRAYNQSRIRQMQPALNLHIALVRGNRSKLPLIKEEALFLTRTTLSNELISHTALTEAHHLKSGLLQHANIQREEEDKVLIMAMSNSYQDLLTKQSEHLLTKLDNA